MGLSEADQKILDEMERALHQEDPGLVQRVRSETVYRYAGRNCIWAAVAFVASLLFMFFSFASSIWLGFVGIVGMFAAGIFFINNARRLGIASIDDVTRKIHGYDFHPSSSARNIFNRRDRDYD
jgi:hypothetical protein